MKIDAQRLKKLRAACHWSQEQLSEASGLSLRTIQRLENGGTASLESIRALSVAFGIHPDELTLDDTQPLPTTPFEAVETALLQFANFSGTATRFEYWWFFAFVLLVTALCTIFNEKAYLVAGVILLVPLIAAGSRRLHDTGQSGWWQLLCVVPFGQIVVLYLLSRPSRDAITPPLSQGFDVV